MNRRERTLIGIASDALTVVEALIEKIQNKETIPAEELELILKGLPAARKNLKQLSRMG